MDNHEHSHHHHHSHPPQGSDHEHSSFNEPLPPTHIEITLKVTGVDCNDEVEAIISAFKNKPEILVRVNLMAGTVQLRYPRPSGEPSPSSFHHSELIKIIESVRGIKVVQSLENVSFLKTYKSRILLIVSSGLFLVLAYLFKQQSFAFFTLSTLLAGSLVFPKAWRSLLEKSLDMNVLMTLAVFGAFGIQEYSEAATVVFLFSLAELIESFSIYRARNSVREALKLVPQVAHKNIAPHSPEPIWKTVPIEEIHPQDLIEVKSGEMIPLDGIILEGNSFVNEASLTGESRPIEKNPQSLVYAGTLNLDGKLILQVTHSYQDTKISKITELIENAQSHKAPSEQFVDRFARYYTPLVFGLAVLISIIPPLFFHQNFEPWFYRALVLLVIGCPCALVLSTPVSIVSGLAALARKGIVVKGGAPLEALGKIKAIALDKTGTLTKGTFQLKDYEILSKTIPEEEILKITATLESASTHPLAQAIIKNLQNQKKITPLPLENYKTKAGRGVEAWIHGHLYFAGNHRMAHELGVCTPELEEKLSQYEAQAYSVIVVGHSPHPQNQGCSSGDVLAIFALGDELKENAQETLLKLNQLGVNPVVILSGDHQHTVNALLKSTQAQEGYGNLLPENKVEKIIELKEKYTHVAMVGDGINDAPALAQATVGISMGTLGTDLAIETSDILLMKDELHTLPFAIQGGRRVLNTIRINIGLALTVKFIFLILATFGLTDLWLAVFSDVGVSVLVTLNAVRLLRD